MTNISRYTSVGRMTMFMIGRPGNRGSIVVSDYNFCSFPKDSDSLWGPPSCQWVPSAAYTGVKRPEGLRLTTHLQLVSRLRMNGVLLLIPHTPSWSGRRKFYLLTFSSLNCVILVAIFENESLACFYKVCIYVPTAAFTDWSF